jgi:hypothetical protein
MTMTLKVSRRSILARGAAGATAVVLPAVAGPAILDPIFAVIELHREAYGVCDETYYVFSQKEVDPAPGGIVVGEYDDAALDFWIELVELGDDQVIDECPTREFLQSLAQAARGIFA